MRTHQQEQKKKGRIERKHSIDLGKDEEQKGKRGSLRGKPNRKRHNSEDERRGVDPFFSSAKSSPAVVRNKCSKLLLRIL